MVFNLFNIVFFSSILVFLRLTPFAFHKYIFILTGVIFTFILSPISGIIFVVLSGFHVLGFIEGNFIGNLIVTKEEKQSTKDDWKTDHIIIASARKPYFWLPLLCTGLFFVFLVYQWLLIFPPFNIEHFRENVFLVGFYGLWRHFHAYQENNRVFFRRAGLANVLAYLWYPCLAFSGPLETIEDFIEKRSQNIQWKKGLLLVSKAFLLAFFGELIFTFFTDPQKINNYNGISELLLHIFGLFWLTHFRLSSYLSFTRGFSTLYGIAFDKPNFNKPFSATSPIRFFSRWNASVPRFIGRYFLPRLQKMSSTIIFLSVLFFFILFGLSRSITSSFIINMSFGLIIGFCFLWEFFWFKLKIHYKMARKINRQIPKSLCIMLTLLLIHLLFAVSTNEFPLLMEKLFIIISQA